MTRYWILLLTICHVSALEINLKDSIAKSTDTVITSKDVTVGAAPKASMTTREWKVEPATAYELTMEVRMDGPNNLENKPPMEYYFKNKVSKSPRLPQWRLNFKLQDGKTVSQHGIYRRILNPDNQWHTITDRFYTPRNTATLQLSINGGDEDRLTIRRIKLEKLPVSEVISINSDFALGEYNYSGIMTLVRGCLDKNEEGQAILAMPTGWYMSYGIPVNGGESLRLSIDVDVPRKSTAGVWFYAQGKNIGKSTPIMIWKGKPGRASYDLKVPANADEVRLVAGSGNFKMIKLERIKGEPSK